MCETAQTETQAQDRSSDPGAMRRHSKGCVHVNTHKHTHTLRLSRNLSLTHRKNKRWVLIVWEAPCVKRKALGYELLTAVSMHACGLCVNE